MIEKSKNIIKAGLICVVLLSFIGSNIAMAEQTNTTVVQNESKYKQLEHPINSEQVIIPNGRIVNRTDLENVTVVKNGTIQIPNNTHGKARVKAFEKARGNLIRELNMSHDEWFRIECKSNGKCTYQVIKNSNTPSVPAAYDGWDIDAYYTKSGGTTSFSGEWTVPVAPTNTTNTTTQTIFYFLGLENSLTPITILQPVLQWGQAGRKEWEIQSYYANTTIIDNSSYVAVAVGDTLNAGITQDSYNPGWWDVDIVDITQDIQVGLAVYDTSTYSYNFVTLETRNVNTCDQFPGSADFYNLNIDSVTPSWTPRWHKTGCGLDVTIVSPSEVILNTRGPLADWNYTKVKTITGTTAGAQTNYQMKLTVYNSTGTDTPGNIYLGGNAKSDFSDLRFTKSDGITLLDYWIESYSSGVNATVWVEVDSIPASPNTASIYVYYGNPSATSLSNGFNTFEFFDDFNRANGAIGNGWVWAYGPGSAVIENGAVKLVGGWIKKEQNVKFDKVYVESKFIAGADSRSTYPGTINVLSDPSNRVDGIGYTLVHTLNVGEQIFDTNGVKQNIPYGVTDGTWYNYKLLVNKSQTLKAKRWRTTDVEPSSWNLDYNGTLSDDTGATRFWMGDDTGSAYRYFDNVRVRKYANPEPTWG